jgi:2-polyprenyl-3-methyl-5-hydroxy-6-metoxy-1,4-benzoquinol methylase
LREAGDMDAGETERLAAFALRVWGFKQGEVVSLMVHLGDRLGLYRALAGAGQVTAAQLAEATGLQERWLLEWLRGQAAAGLIDSRDGTAFALSPEAIAVLADREHSVWFAAGAFYGGVVPPPVVDRLAEAFRTGAGLSYDDLGPAAAHAVEGMLEPWTRQALVQVVVPALDGVAGRLRAGASVLDVGCGTGVAVTALAAAFPRSQFEGWDPSRNAIDSAEDRAATSGLENVSFRCAKAEDLPPSHDRDLVLTLDCIHDMPHPVDAIAAIRQAIRPDGTWLIKDIRSSPTWAGNLKNPVLALLYGTSVAFCLSSGLSEPDGAGLGTLGFPPEVAERMCRAAGFREFTIHDFEDPANLYYEVRP